MAPAKNLSLLRGCGILGLAGCAVPIPADVISWVIAGNYNPVSQSISALAVGPSSWLIDLGLWAFVVGCLAVAAGIWALRLPARPWLLSGLAVLLLAVDVGVIAQLNQYAGQENIRGDVHTWAVYALWPLVALAALFAAPGLERIAEGEGRASQWIGIAWIVLCQIYLVLPTSWNGAFERFLALLMLGWIAGMAWRLRTEARRVRTPTTSMP